ncbi:MAG: zf-HC2 domain-containing protein [Candidatus Omnitrophica bacterium]|nr:zf-HC2 domain-containing protein [Candidatus Omnitrophota bacterium]
MRCEKVQESILTDYLDAQMNAKQKKDIELHLAGCVQCREFSIAAQKTVIEPFEQAQNATPPSFLWPRIKNAILSGQEQKESFLEKFWLNWKPAFYIPKPAFVFATVAMFIILFGVVAHLKTGNLSVVKTTSGDQTEYLSYLSEESEDTIINEGKGLGTAIEEYFL